MIQTGIDPKAYRNYQLGLLKSIFSDQASIQMVQSEYDRNDPMFDLRYAVEMRRREIVG